MVCGAVLYLFLEVSFTAFALPPCAGSKSADWSAERRGSDALSLNRDLDGKRLTVNMSDSNGYLRELDHWALSMPLSSTHTHTHTLLHGCVPACIPTNMHWCTQANTHTVYTREPFTSRPLHLQDINTHSSCTHIAVPLLSAVILFHMNLINSIEKTETGKPCYQSWIRDQLFLESINQSICRSSIYIEVTVSLCCLRALGFLDKHASMPAWLWRASLLLIAALPSGLTEDWSNVWH